MGVFSRWGCFDHILGMFWQNVAVLTRESFDLIPKKTITHTYRFCHTLPKPKMSPFNYSPYLTQNNHSQYIEKSSDKTRLLNQWRHLSSLGPTCNPLARRPGMSYGAYELNHRCASILGCMTFFTSVFCITKHLLNVSIFRFI